MTALEPGQIGSMEMSSTAACPEEQTGSSAAPAATAADDSKQEGIEASAAPEPGLTLESSSVALGGQEDQQQLQPSPSLLLHQSPLRQGSGQDDPSAGLHRLKIVGIPASYSEEQLRSLFQLCGSVAESRIVHDKQSGRPVGYGYVSFYTKEAADLAISTFDDQLQLQGAANYLSVYYAKKQHDTSNDKESCPARNAKLYFCGTPAGLRRDSILALFSAFGRVRHLQVYTDSYGVLSSGTVTMYSTDEAIAAMNSLDGKVLQAGTAPLKVTWAQLSTLPRRNPAGGGPPPPMPRGFTVSYACIPTFVTPAEVAATFERFGLVLQVVPFAHRREGPANSRGCGLVVMDSEQAAMAAVEALSGVFTWPGAERALLVQPFYGAERLAPHQLSSLSDMQGSMGGPVAGGQQAGQYSRGGSAAGGSSSGGGGGMRAPTNHNSAASAGPRAHNAGRVYQQHWPSGNNPGDFRQQQGNPSPAAGGIEGQEAPPPGCAADAFKLVLMNLPASYTQADIFSLLQPYGAVVTLTHIPAGELGPDSAAAVWYATAAQADAALAALSNTVLMAAEGTRQLELRAFKAPGRFAGNRQQQQQQQGMQQGQHGAGWHNNPTASQGLPPGIQQSAVSYQQHQPQQQQHHHQQQQQQLQMSAVLQQGGLRYGAAQQGVLGGDQGMGQVWVQSGGGGGGVNAGPPGINSNINAGGQLAALVAATVGMSSGPNPYSMQQLLYMLPQQQQQPQQQPQQQVPGGVAATAVAGGWPGGVVLPPGAVSLSSNSNIESTLQSLQGGTDPSTFLGPPASAAGGLLAPPGAGYTGWLG